MLGARKITTGAYMEIREDCDFAGNNADGQFLEVPSMRILTLVIGNLGLTGGRFGGLVLVV